MSWVLAGDLKVVEKLWEQILEIVELNAEVEDAVLGVEAAEEEASTNAAVVDVDLVEEEDSFAAGSGEGEDTTVEREERLAEDMTAAVVGEEHSAAAVLVEGIHCCHPVEELFIPALVAGRI